MAVAVLQRLIHHPDPLEANRRTLEALRDGIPLVLNPGESAITVYLVDLDLNAWKQRFTVTDQYKVKGEKACAPILCCWPTASRWCLPSTRASLSAAMTGRRRQPGAPLPTPSPGVASHKPVLRGR